MNRDTVSLEVARELQAAGYKNDNCCFWWYLAPGDVWLLGDSAEMMNNGVQVSRTTAPQFQNIGAPTATRLAEELPMRMKYNIPGLLNDCTLVIWKLISEDKNTFAVFYEGETFTNPSPNTEVIPRQIGTLPDALGKMMVYLLTNKLI